MALARRLVQSCSILLLLAAIATAQNPSFHYFRVGHAEDKVAQSKAGFALMGGGTDLDEAFRFLCQRAGGGDFLVLRSHGDDEYNGYIQKLCPLNSVATIVIPGRDAASAPAVAEKIREASGIFIAGGDQATYINFWMGTPVQSALNDAIRRGVPLGGTSAGLAVLGEYAYTAQGDKPEDPNLDAKTAIADPFGPRITLVRGFVDIPILKGMITDTHFAARNRMGRLLVFLARLNAAPASSRVRGIGVEQRAALLLEPDGQGKVIGHGSAYFVEPTSKPSSLGSGKPLSGAEFKVQKVAPGHSFNIREWQGDVAATYNLSIDAGAIRSTQTGGAIY